MKHFDFTRLLGNNLDSTAKAKQEKRKRGRTARIEELEGREMLDAGIWGAIQDHYGLANSNVTDGDSRYEMVHDITQLRNALANQEREFIVVNSLIPIELNVVTGQMGQLDVNRSVTIAGWAGGTATVPGASVEISANNQSRVFNVAGPANTNVVLAGLIITDGHAFGETGTGSSNGGAGILHVGGNLTVVNSIIAGNTSGNHGAGILSAGAQGTRLIIANSVIAGNTVDGGDYGSGGGVFSSSGRTDIVNSTIVENTASEGAGVWLAGNNHVYNTIVALNIGGNDVAINQAAAFPGTNNLIGTVEEGRVLGNNLHGVDAELLDFLPYEEDSGWLGRYHPSDDSIIVVGTSGTLAHVFRDGSVGDIEGATHVANGLDGTFRDSETTRVPIGAYEYNGDIATALTSITTSTNSPQVDTTITTTLTPSGAMATYQWFRGDIAITGATSSSYTVTANDAGFILRVVATGTGSYTGTASHTLTNAVPTPTVGIPPTAPTNLAGANVMQDRLTLTWNPSDNATGYELWYRSTTSSAEPTRIDISGGQAASHPITDLLPSTTYTFQLRAVNTTGISNWAYATITTPAALLQPPAMPANFAVKSGSVTSNSVTLTWSGQVGLTGYILQYKESTSDTWLDYNTSIPASATEIDISGLIAGTKYDFRLTARNADGTSIPAELRNIETIGLGTNYAVLFAGGYNAPNNHIRYYEGIKQLYEVLINLYGLDRANVYVVYADGTNPAVDLSNGQNSDMSFANGSSVLPATYTNLDAAFTTLGNKMTANDHLLFFTYDHGSGSYDPSRNNEESLTGWGTEISGANVARSVEKIKQGHITLVFSQCFAGGILDKIIDPVTGAKKISTDAQIYGMASSNHYEVGRSSVGGGFAFGFINALRVGKVLTTEAFAYAKSDFGYAPWGSIYVAQGNYPNNGHAGTVINTSVQHPWGIGETFSVFVSGSNRDSYTTDFLILADWNDSLIITNTATSTIDSLEFVRDDQVYVNFSYNNPLGADVSATVTVVGGNLTQPMTFDMNTSSFTEDESGIGHLTTNLNLGTFGSGFYTVCVELLVNGGYTVFERSFVVMESSADVGDTLDDAMTILIGGTEYVLSGILGDGMYGVHDVDIFRYDAANDDIGKTLVFSTIADSMSSMPVDTYLRLFSATGVELASSVFSFNQGVSSLFYTIATLGTYYIAVSSLDNVTYDPNIANSGTEGNVGHYQLSGYLAETKADLSMFYDFCWIDNLVVTTSATGMISDVNLTANDTLYINYKFTNSGYAVVDNANVVNRITITGPNGYSRSEDFTMNAPLAPGEFYTLPGNYEWGKFAAGEYTITIILDVNGTLSELTTENNMASWEFAVTQVGATELDKPVLHTVSNAGKHHTIKAEWMPGANNANALCYEIRVYLDSSLTTRVHTEPADKNLTELEFAVNGLGAENYYVVVVAIGDAVNFDTSTYTTSDAKPVTITSNPAAIPLHIRVAQTGIDAVTVSWNPVWNSSAGYQVWQHVSGEGEGAEWKLVATVTGTTATITGLNAGDYQFRVVAQGQPETRELAEFSSSSASDTATITVTGTIDAGSVNSNFRFQARADNRATTTTTSAITVNLNTNATRALEGILYYELTYGIRGGEMRTIIIAGDAKNAVIAGLQANTTYRVEIQAYDKDGNAILKNSRGVDMPTVVNAKTLRGDQNLRAPNKITRAAGINSVTLNFSNAGNIPSNATHMMIEVWQGKNFVRTEFAELASIRANGNLYVVEDLSRNPNNHNRGLAHQFRIATITNIGEENQTISAFARINQATVNLNKDGRFPAVKNFRVTYPASGQLQLTWNASPVSEVTHYEIGLRNGSSIMSFTIDQLNTIEALVADIDGAEIIDGIIRFDKSITSTGALALGIGFKENLAIRAVVVNEDGNITAQSANANRSVNVRQ